MTLCNHEGTETSDKAEGLGDPIRKLEDKDVDRDARL
jgi:hypothetical protein